MATLEARLAGSSPALISVFRVIIGLLFFLHGTAKLFGWPVGEAIPVGTWPFWWAGLIETVVGALVTLGVFTRIAAFIGAGEMAVAYFWQHWPGKGGEASFWPMENGGEVVLLFCFGLLLLAGIGGGTYAVDSRRRVRTAPAARTRTSRWRR